MVSQTAYKKQQRLSFIQFLTEIPDFVALLISTIFSRSLLVFVDLLDSFGELCKASTTVVLSKKLSKDLRYEYNYGVGKVEAISALLCEGIIVFGVLLTLGLSVYELVFPSKPSDFLIFVVGLKIFHVGADALFLRKEYKIKKECQGAIVKANYASAVVAVLFDSATLVSLLIVWIFRDSFIGGYISPIITIVISIYLLIGSAKRNKVTINELTEKTLPEEVQLKIFSIMTLFHHRYADFYTIKSKKSGDCMIVDLHLSFLKNTTFEEIESFRRDVQMKLNEKFEKCQVNIVLQDLGEKAQSAE